MAKTVVGLYDTTEQANKAKQALIDDGYSAQHMTVVANGSGGVEGQTTSDEGVGEKISDFFKSLVGGDDDAHQHYANGVNRGGALLAVTGDNEDAEEIAAALKEHGARDIDNGRQGLTDQTRTGSSASGTTAIPIVEEELVVGKREVDRGGVRVYSHVVEHPVTADVTLHDEYINVERRTVNRPATAADFAAGSGQTIELNATGEEAVVGKTSRVVEEVLVGKQGSSHTESIQDSVRKTEVDVEDISAEATDATTRTNRY